MKHVGLIGFPVRHSLSPRMQNAAFKALNIDACYELWETPAGELEARINTLRASDMLGANVTIPHKEAVLPWLDEITPQAGRIGAVNTIVNRAGRLVGYNTDAPGFLRAVQEKTGPAFELAGKAVVILGNGGAARGAAIALLDSQVGLLSILGRDEGRIEMLLTHIRQHTETGSLRGARLGTALAEQCLAEADILVNTTSVGLQEGDETVLIEVERLVPAALVMDMIFNPPATPLLRAAARRGCAVLNGLSMLLYQGTLAFELWTGQNAPVDVMRAALGLV
ncbi:MAG TPA: shikimate dehydrogenase [Ktedonobacteraceae bacterium]|nr:shikimate dehydrogenase [Ktedonobacteraceae bacterium]